jgi:hypothetical protein
MALRKMMLAHPCTKILSARIDLILARAKSKEWWALKDLNLRPTDYESAALTAELRARLGCNFLNYPDLRKFNQFSSRGRRHPGASFGVSCARRFISIAGNSIQFGDRLRIMLWCKVSVSHRHL